MRKNIETVAGYKATDSEGKCKGFQFDLPKLGEDGKWKPGKWHKHSGPVVLCESGFHFCEHPSGPWAYYSAHGTRVFKVEAREVTRGSGPGADLKHVCRQTRLVEEVSFTGNWNTGYRNTGDGNTGDRNTGDRNTGDRNTGDGNTGYGNTGYGNATDRCTGFFCQEVQTVRCFDVDTGLTFDRFMSDYPSYQALGDALLKDTDIDPAGPWKVLPGFTPEKLKTLHDKFKAARNVKP